MLFLPWAPELYICLFVTSAWMSKTHVKLNKFKSYDFLILCLAPPTAKSANGIISPNCSDPKWWNNPDSLFLSHSTSNYRKSCEPHHKKTSWTQQLLITSTWTLFVQVPITFLDYCDISSTGAAVLLLCCLQSEELFISVVLTLAAHLDQYKATKVLTPNTHNL
jgi:hypothetical protein